MTDAEKALLAFCLDYSFREGPEDRKMNAADPIGLHTLQFLRDLEELRLAVLRESAGDEILEFVREARRKRDAARDDYKLALAEAESRWGKNSVDAALCLVFK